MVRKLADPPMKLEIGSARKTPSTPRPKNFGRISVRGTTMITFLGRLVYKHFLEDKKNGRKIYFTSLVKRDDYLPRALQTFIGSVFSGDRVELAKLLVADMSKDELAATHDIL